MPGSKSMLTVSASPLFIVSLSVGQLKGGSIRRVTVVARGPELVRLRVRVMGIEATPFSQRYLK